MMQDLFDRRASARLGVGDVARLKLAILDDYQGVALSMADWSALAPRVEIADFQDTLGEDEALVQRLLPFSILCLMRERTPMPRRLIERLPNLRYIFTSGMRNRSIDLDACSERGIVVTGSPTLDHPTAELTIGLMLALARQIPREDRSLHDGGWATVVGRALKGSTLGILGLGRMGLQVARLSRAFDMRVLAWSSNLTAERCAEVGVEFAGSKAQLLRESDFVSVHLMLGDRSRGTIGAAEFAMMKRSAYLINTGRAEIVDQPALIDALSNGHIAGAALDVYEQEPLPVDHPLRRLDRAILMPHQGYVVEQNYRLFFQHAVGNIRAWLDGKIINQVTDRTGPQTTAVPMDLARSA
jgi:phosphoglycerate dehydrogenase-like enzyme